MLSVAGIDGESVGSQLVWIGQKTENCYLGLVAGNLPGGPSGGEFAAKPAAEKWFYIPWHDTRRSP